MQFLPGHCQLKLMNKRAATMQRGQELEFPLSNFPPLHIFDGQAGHFYQVYCHVKVKRDD